MTEYLLLAVVVICIIGIVRVNAHSIDAVSDCQKAATAERKYLLDRIQSGSAETAARLNVEPGQNKDPVTPAKVNFGTAYGLKVDRNSTKEGVLSDS